MGTFKFTPHERKERNDLTNENPTPLYTKTDDDDDDGDTLVSFRIDDFVLKLLICLVLTICSDLLLFGSKMDASSSGSKGATRVF